MFSTLLRIVQSYCREYALPVPGALTGSSDAGALQLTELCQTTGEYIWGKTNWEQCSRRVVFGAPGGSDLGNLYTLCPENLAHIVPNTFWNNTLRRPMYGPVSDVNWQSQLALNPPGPLYYFRIAGSRIITSAPVPVGHQLSMIYKSKNWVLDGVSPRQDYNNDNNTSVFSDLVMKAGLRAHWLRAKQMPHKYEFDRFDDLAQQEAAQNSVKPILRLDDSSSAHSPGLLIPIGNWTIAP